MQNQKDILFYSNYCEFSKDVINIITKQNIRSIFMFVCIDDNKFKIPEFIDRVPSILKQTGEVYTDNQLYSYLDMKFKVTNLEEISPAISVYGNSLYSSHFSSLDGDDNSIENKNYLSLGHEQHMIHVPESTNTNTKGADTSSAFEKFMLSRKLEDQNLKQTMKPL